MIDFLAILLSLAVFALIYLPAQTARDARPIEPVPESRPGGGFHDDLLHELQRYCPACGGQGDHLGALGCPHCGSSRIPREGPQ